MNVFELFAKLGLDTSEYDEGLENSESKGRSFGETLGNVVATGAAIGTAAIAATAAAVVSLSASFAEGIQETAAYGDEIEKNAQKLGLSNSAYQEWDYVLNIAGTSMSNMSLGMKTLTNKIDDAKNGSEDAIAMFESLGVSMEDLQTLSREDIFEQTIYGFTELEDSTERAALANDLFGRSGQELTPLFNMTQEEISDLIDTANEYGMVMSDEAVEASASFQDSLTTLEGTMNGLKNNMLAEFLPSVSTVMDGLSSIFAGDDSGLSAITEGVSEFTSKLSTVLPKFIEIGASIVASLATSIIENAPVLLSSVLSALGTIVSAILDNSDMIIDAAVAVVDIFISQILDPNTAAQLTQTAVDIIAKLANALSVALPNLIPAVVSIITTIVEVLLQPENLNTLIECALSLITAIADGLVSAFPMIVSLIPDLIINTNMAVIENFPLIVETLLGLLGALFVLIVESVTGLFDMTGDETVDGLAQLFSDIGNWGADVIEWLVTWSKNIISGVGNAVADVIQWFVNLGTNVVNAVQTLWNNVTAFFTNGFTTIRTKVTSGLDSLKNLFTGAFDTVKNTVQNAIDFIKGLFNFEWSLPKIKLPHFSVTGSLDLLATPPKLPSVGISWYKKAMEEPYMLNEATIFGASGGKLLGAGESGSEIVIGTNKLMEMMKNAVGVNARPITINVYGAEGQDVRLLAKEVSKELQNLVNDKESVYA